VTPAPRKYRRRSPIFTAHRARTEKEPVICFDGKERLANLGDWVVEEDKSSEKHIVPDDVFYSLYEPVGEAAEGGIE